MASDDELKIRTKERTMKRVTQQTHFVEFFDSFWMVNRVSLCKIIRMFLSEDPEVEDMATVEVEKPIRKRLRVPISCITCRYTGVVLG